MKEEEDNEMGGEPTTRERDDTCTKYCSRKT
jgi:hypothetical protein